jgi:hypothetical protein
MGLPGRGLHVDADWQYDRGGNCLVDRERIADAAGAERRIAIELARNWSG